MLNVISTRSGTGWGHQKWDWDTITAINIPKLANASKTNLLPRTLTQIDYLGSLPTPPLGIVYLLHYLAKDLETGW